MYDAGVDVEYTNAILDITIDAKRRIKELQEISRKFVESNDLKMQSDLKEEMKLLMEIIKDKIKQSDKKLEQVKARINERVKSEGDYQMKNSVTRFQFVFSNALQTQIFGLIKSFSSVQSKIKKDYQTKSLEQLQRDNPNIDKALFKKLVDNPEKMNEILAEMGAKQTNVAIALQEINKRVNDIDRLESRMVGLLEMIKDLHNIMVNQSAAIDSVNSNMQAILDHVEPANKEIQESQEISSSIQEVR